MPAAAGPAFDEQRAAIGVAWGTTTTSWSLLVIMTFTIVAQLKHIKETIYVPD